MSQKEKEDSEFIKKQLKDTMKENEKDPKLDVVG
jgi:hypothetical protein